MQLFERGDKMTLIIITKDLLRYEYNNILEFCHNSTNEFLLFRVKNKDKETVLGISMRNVKHYSIFYKKAVIR